MYNKETDIITYKDITVENFFKDFPQQNYIKDYVKDNLMMLCVRGSHAYGLNTETSDMDIGGIFKDSIDQILGYGKIEQLQASNNDVSIYSFTKAINLIAEQNPNMLELLWVDEEEILYSTADYWYLRQRRDELLSKLTKHKFSGYAMSQLGRIRGHNKWLTMEQGGKFKSEPRIENYLTYMEDGYTYKHPKFSKMNYFTKIKDNLYNVYLDFERQSTYPLIEEGNNFIPEQIEKQRSYDEHIGILSVNKQQFNIDIKEYADWKKWKENRNEKRHELEESYGYDTKHAMHTFRLLEMGIEILNEHEVLVKRPDRDFLLDIKNGKYSYEWIVERAEKMDKEIIQKAYENSTLRDSVDKKVVLDITKRILGV